MKRVVICGVREGGIVEAPRPHAKDNWVVVKVHTIPMCTEYKRFLSGEPADYLGHEAAGEVIEVAQSGRVKVGDHVVAMPLYACGKCPLCLSGNYIHCQDGPGFVEFTGSLEGTATYAEYLLKPDWLLVPIPDGMSYEHASMACCGLGPTFGAFECMSLDVFDTVMITGLGPVGLGGVINARFRGARVIAVDSQPYRARLARELGAVAVVDPTAPDALQQVLALTDGRGVDKALDCSGVVAAHRLCIDATRRRGTVVFVGESSADTPLRVSPDMIRKGLILMGSWHYNLKDAPRLMRVIAENGPGIDKLITHTYALDDVRQAWELQLTGNCGKVLLHPREGGA